MGYASVAGVEWVLLTNGSHWRIYNSHAPVPVEEKIFRSVGIAEVEPADFARTVELLSKVRLEENAIEALWQAQFVDRQIQTALQDLFSEEPDAGIVRAVRQRTKLPLHDVRAGLARARLRFDFPLVDASTGTTAATIEDVVEPRERRSRQDREQLKRQVAVALTDEPTSISDLALKVRLPVNEVRPLLRELRDDGAAEMSGAGKGARWSLRPIETGLEVSTDVRDVETQALDERDEGVVDFTSYQRVQSP
jgi:ParB-like chromosome segregation protein Spo0J